MYWYLFQQDGRWKVGGPFSGATPRDTAAHLTARNGHGPVHLMVATGRVESLPHMHFYGSQMVSIGAGE